MKDESMKISPELWEPLEQEEKDAEKIEERLYQAEEIREEEKEHEPRQSNKKKRDTVRNNL